MATSYSDEPSAPPISDFYGDEHEEAGCAPLQSQIPAQNSASLEVKSQNKSSQTSPMALRSHGAQSQFPYGPRDLGRQRVASQRLSNTAATPDIGFTEIAIRSWFPRMSQDNHKLDATGLDNRVLILTVPEWLAVRAG